MKSLDRTKTNRRFARVFFAAIALCAAATMTRAEDVTPNADGSITIAGIPFTLLLQNGKSVATSKDVKPADGFPTKDASGWHFKGSIDFNGTTVAIEESLNAGDSPAFTVKLGPAKPVDCETAAFVARLPSDKYAGVSLTYNGGASELPATPNETVLLWKANIETIGIPLLDDAKQAILLGGTLSSCVADQRKWGDNAFGLRLLFPREANDKTLKENTLSFSVSVGKAGTAAVETKLPTNLALWQAPHWNTSARTAGSAIEVHTKQRDWNQYLEYRLLYPRDVARCVFSGKLKTTDVAGGTAPIEAARAQLVYRNTAGEQIGGWPSSTVQTGTTDWTPFMQDHSDLPAGVRYIDVCIGLYVSTGTAAYDALDVHAFDRDGKAIDAIPVPKDEHTDTTGWRTLDTGPEQTSRPLAIDLSRFIPAPAGQFGHVTVKDGHFAFDGNGQRIRFWGVGWDHRGTLDQNAATAAGLTRLGINLVRFHGLDGPFMDRAIYADAKQDTQTLNPAIVDQFDNYFAELKKHGIYSDVDLLAYRPFTTADGVADADKLTAGGGVAAMFDPTLIELQKKYAKQLLDRVNPYTGLRYADDPALALVELKNETSFHLLDFMGGVPQSYRDQLNVRFAAWLGDRRKLGASDRFETLIRNEDPDAIAFSVELTRSYFKTMRDYLRNDLGIKCPIAGTQALGWDVDDLYAAASEADYIDTHGYWDHPAGGWDPLSLYTNRSIFNSGMNNFIAQASACHVAGKPFTMSEWNFCWPNESIGEGPLTLAAAALRNDWDAAMVFGFDGSGFASRMESTFKADTKPQYVLPYQLAALAFHRGDIAAAAPVVIAVSPNKAGGKARDLFKSSKSLFDNPQIAFTSDATTLPALQATEAGNCKIDGGRLTIDTPNLQAIVGGAPAAPATTKDISFAGTTANAQVDVIALDDHPIASSNDLLVCAISRAENTGEAYRLFHKGLTEIGHGPLLLEPVSGEVKIARSSATPPTIEMLDLYGRRTGKTITPAGASGAWSIPLNEIENGWAEVRYTGR